GIPAADRAAPSRRPYVCARRAGSTDVRRPWLQSGRIVAQQRAADDLDWRKTLFHELVVKLLERKCGAFHLAIILAQLQDLKLAERVVQVRRIGRAALGLPVADFVRLKAF